MIIADITTQSIESGDLESLGRRNVHVFWIERGAKKDKNAIY